MCGIVGVLQLDGAPGAIAPELIRAMATCIAHRGPDDEGVYVDGPVGLGFRRLSIIDLAGGHQPMVSAGSGCCIVFNGEIYNFPELRRELESAGRVFTSRSDTEVILHAYEEYGDRCVQRLNGMFAFAIWDPTRQRLFLARDRMGKKPLYLYQDAHRLAFASEIKSILQLPGVERALDVHALDSFFSYNFVPEPASIYQRVRRLPPAHTLSVEGGRATERCYWTVPDQQQRPATAEGMLAEELRELLTDAVRIRMISDVPIGVFLSGGIDSSAIAGLMATLSPVPIETFSIRGGDGVFDELPYARAVAERYGTVHHEYDVGSQPLETLLPRLISHFDEPFADSSMIPTYHVSRIAREHVTVALSGEGGDELFAGYSWQRKFVRLRESWTRAPSWLRAGAGRVLPESSTPRVGGGTLRHSLRRLSLANRYAGGTHASAYQAFATSFTPAFKSLVYGPAIRDELRAGGAPDRSLQLATAFAGAKGSLLSRALKADMQFYLPGDLLTKVDRMSMASSLEVRSPLLDYRLVEWAASIPDDLKLHGRTSKYILRRAMAGVIPPRVLERRDKRGFSVPVGEWFRTTQRDYARNVLLDRAFLERGFLDASGVRMVLDAHAAGTHDYGAQIWAMLTFAVWAGQSLARTR